MTSSTSLSSLLLPVGFSYGRSLSANAKGTSCDKVQGFVVRCSGPCVKVTASRIRKHENDSCLIKRRDVIGLIFGVSGLLIDTFDARGAGLPPEQKTRLCDDTCEKEIENVW
uniref:Peptidyl-prolyl cis-trans isomerase FKBP16-3ic isoform X1 n=1 Tax=Rhizophora mucronata TaxID=61149 RepID=A0A2P2KS72_RHIMU